MPRITINVTNRPDIKMPSFTTEQMSSIGAFAIEVLKERNATGIDIFDRPSEPLQPKYAKQKERKGLQPIRDLRLTGNMLGSVQATETADDHVKIQVRGSTPFRKGIFNQNIDPWFGLSPHDEQRLMNERVRPIFAKNVADLNK